MPGSSGILAHPSCTEIVVCPVPGDTSRYYVFYNSQLCSRLYYSVVDLKLRNGNGDVSLINQSIDPSNNFAEGLELVKIPCTKNYWLLTYQCYKGFKRFKVDESGIHDGTLIKEFDSENHQGRGELDYHKGRLGYGITYRNKAFVCDFNPVSGIVSNSKTISFNSTVGIYGLEFSPDASKVYCTDLDNRDFFGNVATANLFSYDFNTSETQSWTIKNNGLSCGSQDPQGLGQIEIGKDQKLYIPHIEGCQVTVIENPNASNPTFSLINVNSILSTGVSDHIQSDFLDEDLSPPPSIAGDQNAIICKNDSLLLWTEYGPNYQYQWLKDQSIVVGANSFQLEAKSKGKYQVKVQTPYGCETTSPFYEVVEPDFSKVELGPDQMVCQGETVTLGLEAFDGKIEWSTGSSSKSISINESGVYWVRAFYGDCYESDTVSISFFDNTQIIIPNVFTPNGDSKNETFTIPNQNIPITLQIFNRWGTEIYRSNNYANDWNGNDLAVGIYFYKITSDYKCFTNRKGWVHLLK